MQSEYYYSYQIFNVLLTFFFLKNNVIMKNNIGVK